MFKAVANTMTLTYLREESVNRKFSVVAGGKQGGDQESDMSSPYQ